MQFNDFLGQVQHRARMDSTEGALRAVNATFATLNERLGGREPAHLAAQLPRELANALGEEGRGERFSSDEFLQRVSRREGADLPDAVYHVRAVFEVLGMAVSPGELDGIRTQLPADYQRLFEAGSEGRMPSA